MGVGCNGLSRDGVKPNGVIDGNAEVAVTSPPIGVLVKGAVGVATAPLGRAVPHKKKPIQ